MLVSNSLTITRQMTYMWLLDQRRPDERDMQVQRGLREEVREARLRIEVSL